MSAPGVDGRELRIALISSGLGYTVRGIEVWMADLAEQIPPAVDVRLWGGGPRPYSSASETRSRRLFSLSRDALLMRGQPWARRYRWEQWSMVPWITMALRFGRRNIAYLGDPVLAWELKRLQRIHRAKVVFMNGMRLSPSWARAFDGVHLLADPYLRDARRELEEGGADTRGFFAVPHFTNLAVFRPASQTERLAARSSLGLPPDAFVVLTLGPIGLTSRKRLDHLAREVAASSTEARLVHAGGGEDGEAEVRAAVNAALGHRIHWKGRVDRGAVGALLAAADAYSLASLAEPFSIAILEALASGIPVVHHDEPVMRWQTGAGGVAVSMEEPGLAAAVFRGLAANPEQRARLGTCARALAESRYSPGPVCAALLEGLHTVAP